MPSLKTGFLTAVVGGASVVALSVSPAFAATSITAPVATGGTYTVPVDANGNALPFTASATGFTPGQEVYSEICDGVSPTSVGYNVTAHCDAAAGPPAAIANSSGSVTFTVNTQFEELPFRGNSPQDDFNCLAPQDVNTSATPKQGMGNAVPLATPVYPPAGDTAVDQYENEPPTAADPSVPSWTNCQLKISSLTSNNTADQQFITLALQNTPPSGTPAFTSGTSTTFTAGQASSFVFTTTGSPAPALTESGALRSGVTFVDNGDGTATLSGTPASDSAGSYPVTVTAKNSVGTATQSFTLNVVAPSAAATISGTPPAGTEYTPYSYAFTVAGSPTPVLTTSGTVPPGLSLSATGVLSGTPTASGDFSFSITATNSVGGQTADFSVAIAPGSPTASKIVATSGGGQSSPPDAAFPNDLTATVTGSTGADVSGATVQFTVTSGSATFASGTAATAVTDASGVATAPTLTAGKKAGPVIVTATTAGVTTEATFDLTVHSGPASLVTLTSGSKQVALEGKAFAKRLIATVTDAEGNKLSGVSVSFTVKTGSATFSGGAKSAKVITTSAGVATAPVVTAGKTAGAVTVTAAVVGVTKTVTYALTVTAPEANLATTLTGSATGKDGGSFTETVKVANGGPQTATSVVTKLVVPSGVTVTNTDHATKSGSTLTWKLSSLASGKSVSYKLTFKVASNEHKTATITATVASAVKDPKTSNNKATKGVKLS